MSFADSSDISFPAGGSNLLSESPLLNSSETGPGGDDLSLSELSLSDRTVTYDDRPSTPGQDDGEANAEAVRKVVARTREESLQSDLFILKKLNTSLTLYNEALDSTDSATDRLSKQLEETDMLLNRYVKALGRTEDVARLLFDQDFDGADADEAVIRQEQKAAAEKARQADEERQLAAQRERARLEKEALARQQQEEKERLERDKAARTASRGGVRGVRGTRASMRGMRGSAPPSQTGASRGRIPSSTSNPGATARPGSSLGRGGKR
ncbi:hypothetical protein BDZ89DRAFT_739534 [Hymenopellis radicata]|nr:hypothetical protein BDZ89DRAFT_739534 [Hymenopellis radicata]